jgi:FKBP-type peptidyl-prolyl cis-trans isomerase SlyD
MTENQIAAGKVVTIHYQLTVADQVLDSSAGKDPLPYLHGYNNIVPGLEEALTGKPVGEKLQVAVSPDKGYGERNEEMTQTVPREQLPDDIQTGAQLSAQAQDGQAIPCWVAEVREKDVDIDFNHPLAGQTLNFEVEVVSVRDASPEEIEHGHVHGPGGHEH